MDTKALNNINAQLVIEHLRKATTVAISLLEVLDKDNRIKDEIIAYRQDKKLDNISDAGLITVKDAAKYIGVSITTLREVGKQGEIPEIPFQGTIRFHIEDINNYIEKCRSKNRTK